MLSVAFELLLSLLIAKFTDLICISEEEKKIPYHNTATGKSQAVVCLFPQAKSIWTCNRILKTAIS